MTKNATDIEHKAVIVSFDETHTTTNSTRELF